MEDFQEPESSSQLSDNESNTDNQSEILRWQELCQVIEQVQAITPVEDPEAERLERILDTVNSYINSEFFGEEIPKVDKIKSSLDKLIDQFTTIFHKMSLLAPFSLNLNQ